MPSGSSRSLIGRLMSVVAALAFLVAAPLGASAAPTVLSCISSGDPLGTNTSFTVDLRLIGNNVGPLSIFSGRVVYDDGEVDLTGIAEIPADGITFPDVGPFFTAQVGAGAGSYRNFSAADSSDGNALNGRFVRLTFEKQGVAGMPSLAIIPNPDVAEAILDPDNNPIPATWTFSETCEPAIVYYSVDGDVTAPNSTFYVYARLAENTELVGALGFSLFFDPSEMTQAGDAEVVPNQVFQWATLNTVAVGANRVNIAAVVADPADSAETGVLFRIPFETTGTPPTVLDAAGVPVNLVLGDNPDILDPLIDDLSNEIPHVFATEPFAGPVDPDVAHVIYSVEGDALTPNSTFTLRVRVANNVLNQPIGGLAFSVLFDPSEIQPTSDAMNVAGSAIQFEQLLTNPIGVDRLNIIGGITDPANTDTEDFLFEIEFQNQGVALASPDCIPLSLIVDDNPDVAPPHLVELDGASTAIEHIFVREDSCVPPPPPSEVAYRVIGDASVEGGSFILEARLATNTLDQPVGGLAFSITFDPSEMSPVGDAVNVAGSDIQFEQLLTTPVGADRVNIAGLISDPGNSSTLGGLFQIEFQNAPGVSPDLDSLCIPVSLVVDDNPDVAPPHLVELNPESSAIDHIFVREDSCPEPSVVAYRIIGDASVEGGSFILEARMATNTFDQPVGGLAFSITFDPSEMSPVGDAVNAPDSDIQFEQLLTTPVGAERVNIAGLISDPGNTSTLGGLFQIEFQNAPGVSPDLDSLCIPVSLVVDDNPDVAPPHLVELDAESSAINHVFEREDSCVPPPPPAEVAYRVIGDASVEGGSFILEARLAVNPEDQPVGGLAFAITFDPSEMSPVGDAVNVAGSDIQFEQLLTTPVGANRVNIAGLISDPGNTSTLGGLFQIEFQNAPGVSPDLDSLCIPVSLVLDDNPDVTPPHLVELNPESSAIDHIFVREDSCPEPSIVAYRIIGDASVEGGSFILEARMATNVNDQLIGGLAFAISFDSSEMSPVGSAVNVAGSPIQFEQLLTTPVGADRVNIAGLISDEENSDTLGGLFRIEFQNAPGVAPDLDSLCMPVNLVLDDNPDVSPPHLVELNPESSAILHVFEREDSCPEPSVVAYRVIGDASVAGGSFIVEARMATNVDDQLIGGLAFAITFDPTEMSPVGSAVNVPGSPIQFEQLLTTPVGADRVNIAGLISDEENSSTLGGLFRITFQNEPGVSPVLDEDCMPVSLVLDDNPDVSPPHLVELNPESSNIPHVFEREDSCAPADPLLAEIYYLTEPVDGPLGGDAFRLLVGVRDPQAFDAVGEFNLMVSFDAMQAFNTGVAEVVAGSAIQPETLTTTEIDPGLLQVSGTISDPLDSSNAGLLFAIPMMNAGSYRIDECLPPSLTVSAPAEDPALVALIPPDEEVEVTFVRDQDDCEPLAPAGTVAYSGMLSSGDEFLLTAELTSPADFRNLRTINFSITFDEDLVAGIGDATNVPGSPIQFAELVTTPGGPGRIDITGTVVSDEGTSPTTNAGPLFRIPMVHTDARLIPGDCLPPSLELGAGEGDPAGTVLDPNQTAIALTFEKGDECDRIPPEATIEYFVDCQDGLTPGTVFQVVARLTSPVDFDNVGSFAFSIEYDPGELQVFGLAENVPGSPIQFSTLDTDLVESGRVSIIGSVTDPANSSNEGLMFKMAFRNTGVTLVSSDGTGIPDSLVMIDDPDVSSDMALVEIAPDSRPIAHTFERVDGTTRPTVVFEFLNDAEGWEFTSPDPFTDTFGTYLPGVAEIGGALEIETTDNALSFGFWESPEFAIATEEENGNARAITDNAVIIRGVIGEGSLYRSEFTLRSDLEDPSLAPVVRLRSSAFDFRQSDLVVSTSTGDGDFSPGTTARQYAQWFSQPAGQTSFRLDYDILNVDPLDAELTSTLLERVSVTFIGTDDLGEGSSVASFDFTEGQTNGFTPRPDESPIPIPAEFQATANGLLIRGQVPGAARQGGDNDPILSAIFGYWGYESEVPFDGNRLHRVRWTVRSDATEENRAELPTFRMRVNDSSLQYSALTNIDSVNPTVPVPVVGEPQSYDLWVQTPDAIVGNTWIFSIDYLFVDKSGIPGNTDIDDPTLAITLERLEITSYPVPALCTY